MPAPRWVWAIVACLWWVALAPGQLAVGCASEGRPGHEHAWVVAPSNRDGQWTLWHLPPRSGSGAAPDGTARPIGMIERQPAAMAAAGGRVWLAVAGMGDRPGFGFLTAAVQRGAIDGMWFTGAGGRLGPAPFLPTRGRLLSTAAGSRGPVVLIEGLDGTASLAWLDMNRWRWVTLPAGMRPQTVGIDAKGGLLLLAMEGEHLHTWRAELPERPGTTGEAYELIEPDAIIELARPRAEDDQAVEVSWTREAIVPAGAWAGGEIIAGPVEIGQRMLLGLAFTDGVRVVEQQGSAMQTLYQGPPGALALLSASRRGVAVRIGEPAPGAPGRAATRLDILEFSLDTGRVLYTGPAVFDGPISASDLRILAVLVVLVSASLLLFVVRTSGETAEYVAPRGFVLAPPFMRLMAALADGVLALFVGGELSRLLPEGWLAVRVGVDLLDFGPLIAALIVGYVASSVLETAFGRTPGKLLFGLLVTRSGTDNGRADHSPRRPSLGASLARNAVKWLLPILALAGAMGPTMRHRGDTMTRLGVVAQAMPDRDQVVPPDDR